jgi:hypothetical protein
MVIVKLHVSVVGGGEIGPVGPFVRLVLRT